MGHPVHPVPGTKIHVSFDAVVRDGGSYPNATTAVEAEKTEEGWGGTTHYLYLGDPSVFTDMTPAPAQPEESWPRFWPPAVGEVWYHGPSGQTYVVRENAAFESRVVLTRNNIRDPEYYVENGVKDGSKYADDCTAVPSEWERLVGSASE
jgi:hypothetical protein